MSYVRWSSDDFLSDIYSYESAEGFVTHVASNRIRYRKPLPPPVPWPPQSDDEWAAYWAREKVVNRRVDRNKHHPIGLPYDGCTFTDASEEAMIARWVMLKEAGYHIPEGLIEAAAAALAKQDSYQVGEDVTHQFARTKGASGMVVSVRLDRAEAEDLLTAAEKSHRTVVQVAHEAIRAALAEQEGRA